MGSLVAELAEKLSSATNSLDFDEQTLYINTSTNKVAIGTNAPVTDLTIDGTLTLKEQADADADTTAYGQIWVNTAVPNELYYTTDSGVDIQITNATGLAADTVQDDYGNVLGHSTAGDALNTSNGGNVALGCNALGAQTTGLNNVAIGCHALAASADDGDLNIAIGKLAMGVGDVSGFVASIFMRGINHIQFPTTLLAMIDSAIGGKTGVNLKNGKNLIGRIHQPSEVIIDTSFLSTLPKRELNASLAEAIKYGFIYDRDLFDCLVTNFNDILELKDDTMLEKIILRSCEIKGEVVSQDVNENELRMILNFGHTVGHAIEAYFDYKKLLHGEAIVHGMKCALYLSNKINNLNESDYNAAIDALSLFALPPIVIEDKDRLIDFVKRDKKFKESQIRFVLIPQIGNVTISKEITLEDIKESLSVL